MYIKHSRVCFWDRLFSLMGMSWREKSASVDFPYDKVKRWSLESNDAWRSHELTLIDCQLGGSFAVIGREHLKALLAVLEPGDGIKSQMNGYNFRSQRWVVSSTVQKERTGRIHCIYYRLEGN